MIKVNWIYIGQGPAQIHQRERSQEIDGIHDICIHIERGRLPLLFLHFVLSNLLNQVV
jgi:hypothetical protein